MATTHVHLVSELQGERRGDPVRTGSDEVMDRGGIDQFEGVPENPAVLVRRGSEGGMKSR